MGGEGVLETREVGRAGQSRSGLHGRKGSEPVGGTRARGGAQAATGRAAAWGGGGGGAAAPSGGWLERRATSEAPAQRGGARGFPMARVWLGRLQEGQPMRDNCQNGREAA